MVWSRLLAENMFAFFHCRGRGSSVQVVGGVQTTTASDVFLFLKQLAEVSINRTATILPRAAAGVP